MTRNRKVSYMQSNPCNKEYSLNNIIMMNTGLRDTQAFLNTSGVDPNRLGYRDSKTVV